MINAELVRLRTSDLAAAPGAAPLSISVERGRGAEWGSLRGDSSARRPGKGVVVLGTLELRVRGWSADYDATSQRSEWNSERKRVMKRRGPPLPACPVRAAPPRWLPGTGKATWVRWRRVGGAADAAFGSPRASRVPWKREGFLQAAWKPGIPGETAFWESGRACPSGLLGIPSALCERAFRSACCSKAASSSDLPPTQPKETHLAHRQTSCRGNLCQAQLG